MTIRQEDWEQRSSFMEGVAVGMRIRHEEQLYGSRLVAGLKCPEHSAPES